MKIASMIAFVHVVYIENVQRRVLTTSIIDRTDKAGRTVYGTISALTNASCACRVTARKVGVRAIRKVIVQ